MNRKIIAREILSLAKEIIAGARDIAKNYPVRNKAWDYHSGNFTTEASMLGPSGRWTDPWKRPIRKNTHVLKEVRDREGDVVSWEGWTTVAGTRVNLIIFND